MRKLTQTLQIFLMAFVFSTFIGSKALAKEALTIVPTKRVCMVTNMVFPKDQIPVTHAGKTYYGCCENCKNTLSTDASARTAIDPMTNKKIDKATAVIAAKEDGSVVYFENQASFQKYQSQSK